MDILTRLSETALLPLEQVLSYLPEQTVSSCASVSKSWKDIFSPVMAKFKEENKRRFLNRLARWRDPEEGRYSLDGISMYESDDCWIHHSLCFWMNMDLEAMDEDDADDGDHIEKLYVCEITTGELRAARDLKLPSDLVVDEVSLSCDFHKDERNSKLFLVRARVMRDDDTSVFIGNRSTCTYHKVMEKENGFRAAVFNDRFVMVTTVDKAKLFHMEWNEQDALVKFEVVDEKDGINGELVAREGKRLVHRQPGGRLSLLTFSHDGKLNKVWELHPQFREDPDKTYCCWVDHYLVAFGFYSGIVVYDTAELWRPPTEVKRISFAETWVLHLFRFGSYGVVLAGADFRKASVVSVDELVSFDNSSGSFSQFIDSVKAYVDFGGLGEREFAECGGCRSDVYRFSKDAFRRDIEVSEAYLFCDAAEEEEGQ